MLVASGRGRAGVLTRTPARPRRPPTHGPEPIVSRARPLSLPVAADAPARGGRIALTYERLRELIVSGRLAPGARLVESEITERLRVSRTPVRSALHRLQQEGYVIAQGRGRESRLWVAPLTQEDARELFSIVGELEGLAARLAAGLAPRPRAELVRRLRQLNDELSAAARTVRDPTRLFDIDMAFHRSYVEAGAGVRLRALHDAIKPQTERYVRLYVSALVDEIGKSVREHDAIVRHIRAGDPDGAQRAAQMNWRNAAERLSRVIASLGERGSW